MELIYGKTVAEYITEQVKSEVREMTVKKERRPRLAIIRVGDGVDDMTYERSAVKKMEAVGIEHEEYYFPEDVEAEVFYRSFHQINENPLVDGILVLRPLPKSLDEERLVNLIKPEKDVDAIAPISLGRLMAGEKEVFAPCTAVAVIEMLNYASVDLKGKKVTIVGRSNVVGRPLALLFIGADATVTICHTRTEDLREATKRADILVAACGSAKLIKGLHIEKGTILIDVGINCGEDGKLCGDIDIEDVKEKASLCTPVPGGVGAVTTSVLAKHVLMARKKKGRED